MCRDYAGRANACHVNNMPQKVLQTLQQLDFMSGSSVNSTGIDNVITCQLSLVYIFLVHTRLLTAFVILMHRSLLQTTTKNVQAFNSPL